MGKSKPHPTEPIPVPDLFATAVSLDGTAEYVRLTGWIGHTAAPITGGAELRVVARLVMPASTARELHAALARRLRREDGG